ncbi:MAG: hypothetical protein PHT16_04110 [Candidatus Pacebacteria bacterium]|nr:hypothetical protein [Candidatus Paceibacterota bacterium]
MHYFEAEAKFGLGPSKSGLWGKNKAPILHKYFSTLICSKLFQLWRNLNPDNIECFFIDSIPFVDIGTGPQTLESTLRILEKEAKRAKDFKTIRLIFFKQYEQLEIVQGFWLEAFPKFKHTNFKMQTCARILPSNCRLTPKESINKITEGLGLFLSWLEIISSHKIFQEWNLNPRFKIKQEISLPPELIRKNCGKVFTEDRFPLPGNKIEDCHLHAVQLAWLLLNCKNPPTEITSAKNGQKLFLPSFPRLLTKALRLHPIPDFPIIKEILPIK